MLPKYQKNVRIFFFTVNLSSIYITFSNAVLIKKLRSDSTDTVKFLMSPILAKWPGVETDRAITSPIASWKPWARFRHVLVSLSKGKRERVYTWICPISERDGLGFVLLVVLDVAFTSWKFFVQTTPQINFYKIVFTLFVVNGNEVDHVDFRAHLDSAFKGKFRFFVSPK